MPSLAFCLEHDKVDDEGRNVRGLRRNLPPWFTTYAALVVQQDINAARIAILPIERSLRREGSTILMVKFFIAVHATARRLTAGANAMLDGWLPPFGRSFLFSFLL